MKTIIIDGIEYNITPKVLFKKGDFVVIQETTYQISKIEGLNVTLSLNGRECLFDIDVLKNARLWDITKDAKDGDVLSYNDGHGNDCIDLIKSITDKKIEFWFCLTNGNRYEVFDGITPYTNLASREDATPATKEQRGLLFQKMHEAGYEWDAEKKELKKIEQKNSEWSEEDEDIINHLLAICAGAKRYRQFAGCSQDDVVKYQTWLKSLRPQKINPRFPQYENIVDKVFGAGNLETWEREEAEQLVLLAKEEVEKALRPQTTWKPSEEMLEALYRVIPENVMEKSENEMLLDKLYQGLKYGRVLSEK